MNGLLVSGPAMRVTHKALHRTLTIFGVDRRLFFLAMLLGAATFNLFYSFLAGLMMFAAFYAFAWWATLRDPEMLKILLSSSRARRRFDPARHKVFTVRLSQ
jgi:type IV secretory pathway TrbD component